jgi:predicted nucleic acid-binding protein
MKFDYQVTGGGILPFDLACSVRGPVVRCQTGENAGARGRNRPGVPEKAPNITPERSERVIADTLERAERVADVPQAFTRPHHPDYDRLLSLAIAAKAERLVTFETRILDTGKDFPDDAARRHSPAPRLRIGTPKELSDELRQAKAMEFEAARQAEIERSRQRDRGRGR